MRFLHVLAVLASAAMDAPARPPQCPRPPQAPAVPATFDVRPADGLPPLLMFGGTLHERRADGVYYPLTAPAVQQGFTMPPAFGSTCPNGRCPTR